jgi:trehalose 6-phosphate phosphatase
VTGHEPGHPAESPEAAVDRLRDRLGRTAVLLDFDGSLAPIVSRPEDARPTEGIVEVVRALVDRALVVAIVTGRPSSVVRAWLPIGGLRVAGLYGFEDAPSLAPGILAEVEVAASTVPGSQVEPKGASVAVHYRNAVDPDEAGARLLSALDTIARAHDLRVLDGKRVWELAPRDAGGKGDAVRALLGQARPDAVCYAGDDVADLESFAVLDEAAASGLDAVKIAVLGAETPVALREAADLTVDGPAGLRELLRRLAG